MEHLIWTTDIIFTPIHQMAYQLSLNLQVKYVPDPLLTSFEYPLDNSLIPGLHQVEFSG